MNAKTALTKQKIGFIGLGLMGKPMCLNLQKAGAELLIFNRSQAVVKALSQTPNISSANSAAAVAEHCKLIVLMLSDTTAVEQVLFGEQGLIHTLQAGTLIIDMGTTAVTASKNFAAKLNAKGVDYVDAPVSGGELGAINASLVIMAGGTTAAIERAKPLFEVLGNQWVHIGEVGTGQVAKAANQMIVGLTIGAVSEALSLAQLAGADLSKVREALMGGFAASRILELHGQRMIEQSFQPGGKISTQHKDMQQALDLAEELTHTLPATALNRDLYAQLIEQGHANLDHSALFLAYQQQHE